MFLLEWTTTDLVLMTCAAILLCGLLLWLVPGMPVERRRHYIWSEITAYDSQIPRYFLCATLALVCGGLHTVVKNVPGFWLWLWEAGYGGHLFRDLANSHIIIVGGGTVLLTGITWYVLPRLVNRPLYSNTLAGASLWLTVIGVFGFYCSWLVLGLVEGQMVRDGWEYMAAKEALGSWHRIPTRVTSSIMGFGYWTYVLNVLLTLGAARHIRSKPAGYLAKFLAVSAAALFVGTVQGVLQVLPENADWIHYAGRFGQYVDPISHAHVNLVTGMMVALAGFWLFFSPRLGGIPVERRPADWLFWTLTGGSLLFYLSFLLLGLILGNAVNGAGGIEAPQLVPYLGGNVALILAVAGAAMLAGFWAYFVLLWRHLGVRRMWIELRSASPAGFWYASSLALVAGTLQGMLQVTPATARLLTSPEEVPNIHAQLNMIGGVLLALIGLVYLLLPELTGQVVSRRAARITLAGIGGGIAGYYVVTLAVAFLRWSHIAGGADARMAAAAMGWGAPLALVLTALPMLAGFWAFAGAVLRSTRGYRRAWWADLKRVPGRFNGPMPALILRRQPLGILAIELLGGLFGWPGLGWLFAGQALIGITLILAGPGVAWALLPMLFSPFTGTLLSEFGWVVLLAWLPVSAVASTAALAVYMRRVRRNLDPLPLGTPAVARTRPLWRRVPIGLTAGTALVLLALFSVPAIPLLWSVPEFAAPPPLQGELPERATGAYLQIAQRATENPPQLLKLFAWNFPAGDFPAEAPAVNPLQVAGLLVSQKGLDDAGRYRLYRLPRDDGTGSTSGVEEIALDRQVVSFQTQLRLAPKAPLAPGDYLFNIPRGGMFAGREFYYFRVDPAAALMATAPREVAVAPAAPASSGPWLTLLPAISALLSGGMACTMALRLRRRLRPHELAWTVAFALFAVAATCQVVGDVWGWTAAVARLYYVTGATLVVGWLGLGTWLLVVHKPWARTAGVWAVLLLSGYAVGLASMASVDGELLASAGWRALAKPASLTVLTVTMNVAGTLIVVGGALWSASVFWRKQIQRERMVGCLLLAGGALIVAAGGSLTRLGHEQYLYFATTIGVTVMFWGYRKTIGSTPARGVSNSTEAASRATIRRSSVTLEHAIHELPQLQHLES